VKKVVLALMLCLVAVSLIAVPAMAMPGKTHPKLFFSTFVTCDGVQVPGAVPGCFIIKTEGVAGKMHTLGLKGTVAKPALADGDYAFTLKAPPAQQAALTTYFAAKGWPQTYLDQITKEIKGTAPFFYLKASGGTYNLTDGFKYALGDTSAPLVMDDDYPVGTYCYQGTIKGTNGASLNLSVILKVQRIPKVLFFTTSVTYDGVKLPGSLPCCFILKTGGKAGTMHTLGLTGTVAKPDLVDGDYAFTLLAPPAQQAALTSYFGAKGWPQTYLDQITKEINGTAPFFYLKASGGAYTLADGFKYAFGDTSAPLLIDDDYPVGTYCYQGTLKGTNGATKMVTVKLKVQRVPVAKGKK